MSTRVYYVCVYGLSLYVGYDNEYKHTKLQCIIYERYAARYMQKISLIRSEFHFSKVLVDETISFPELYRI